MVVVALGKNQQMISAPASHGCVAVVALTECGALTHRDFSHGLRHCVVPPGVHTPKVYTATNSAGRPSRRSLRMLERPGDLERLLTE